MHTLLVTLHVLAVVLVIGPMALAPFYAGRAIRRRGADDRRAAENVRGAANALLAFGTASVIAAGLGVLAVPGSDRYSFRTPWVIVSITVYAGVMALATGYTAPALRKAAKIISGGVLARPERPRATAPAKRAEPGEVNDDAALEQQAPPLITTAADLAAKERLDAISGRITGSGLLTLAGLVLIVVLMVVKPFGS